MMWFMEVRNMRGIIVYGDNGKTLADIYNRFEHHRYHNDVRLAFVVLHAIYWRGTW